MGENEGLVESVPWSPGNPEMLFTMDSIIDEGAFGAVWRGISKTTTENVAIKILPQRDELLDELRSEINFLKQFDSPFVTKYYGTWLNRRSEEIWIVMELAELGSIEGIMIYCEYSFSEEELGALFARVLLALSYIHSKDLVHQDIKAKNILLTMRGEVKLADFGVAASITNVNQNRGTVSGSPHWMAPEILSGVEITQKCDIWSLGITMIELVEGQPPLADIPPINVISVIPERAAPTFLEPQKWSKTIKAFLSRMLEKDPKKRRDSGRLMKHPFVKDEVQHARNGEKSSLLRSIAEECIDTIESLREDMDMDFDEGGVETFSEDDYDSEEESSTDDEGPMFIKKGVGVKKKNNDHKKASFASVVMDPSQLEQESEEDLRRKMRRTRATKIQGKSRVTRGPGRKRSNKISAINPDKISMMKKKKDLEFDISDVRQMQRMGKDEEETVRKAQLLLSKLQNLGHRKRG